MRKDVRVVIIWRSPEQEGQGYPKVREASTGAELHDTCLDEDRLCDRKLRHCVQDVEIGHAGSSVLRRPVWKHDVQGEEDEELHANGHVVNYPP